MIYQKLRRLFCFAAMGLIAFVLATPTALGQGYAAIAYGDTQTGDFANQPVLGNPVVPPPAVVPPIPPPFPPPVPANGAYSSFHVVLVNYFDDTCCGFADAIADQHTKESLIYKGTPQDVSLSWDISFVFAAPDLTNPNKPPVLQFVSIGGLPDAAFTNYALDPLSDYTADQVLTAETHADFDQVKQKDGPHAGHAQVEGVAATDFDPGIGKNPQNHSLLAEIGFSSTISQNGGAPLQLFDGQFTMDGNGNVVAQGPDAHAADVTYNAATGTYTYTKTLVSQTFSLMNPQETFDIEFNQHTRLKTEYTDCVPEPGSLVLFLPGLAAFGLAARRKRRSA
jgi:hypothetical protein